MVNLTKICTKINKYVVQEGSVLSNCSRFSIDWKNTTNLLNPRNTESINRDMLRSLEYSCGFRNVTQSDLNVVFCDSALMKEVNEEIRKKSETTDVVSLEYGIEDDYVYGDLFINIELAQELQPKDSNKETIIYSTHGILHILGYTHETTTKTNEMKTIEQNVLSKIYPVPDSTDSLLFR